ncbi:hypothetical protein DFA_08947 [Cavenderia fasciculata]|uniref:Uncharacterized protein n=1 Tax=Cavenderia fasciculata TaxID=261658 RepID=F4Q553_CACFS|nr:uncharacterized protein DFA_08947 [Cavenderia fasciculata]EGG17946.1 hypothetical protein DFA_08947 [Cavenderia fasciculata]|eukprot:XP_004356430.1 hypothetical protein DFA_08947 [Cavenderia fasciculata]
MKGDRMPTILSPIALAIGEDYTDRWLDYLLDPLKLKDHLKELKNNTTNHPNEASIVKTLMKQYEKGYKGGAAANISSPPPPTATATTTSTTLSANSTPTTTTTNLSTITTHRLKMLVNLVIIVITEANLSLSDIGKIIQAFKHQRLLVEELESSQPNDSVFHTYLKRWIIRGIIKGDPLKYLINSSHALFSKTMVLGGTASPLIPSNTPSLSLQQTLGLIGIGSNSSPSNSASSTPPSSPPPTPPQYISIQSTKERERDSPIDILQKEPEILVLEQITKDCLDFLIDWIDKYRNNKDLQPAIAEITLELGEYYFYKQEYSIAKDYFNQSLKYGEFNSKERAKSFLIACKSMMDQEDDGMMKIDSSDKIIVEKRQKDDDEEEEESTLEKIELAIVNNQQDKILEYLYIDIIDSTLNWQFRTNLERHQIIHQNNRINIFILNLIKSIIYQNSFNFNYDIINQFNEKSFEFLFNTVHKFISEEKQNNNQSTHLERLTFHLNRIGYILNNDQYWIYFKRILPKLYTEIDIIEKDDLDEKMDDDNDEIKLSKFEIYGEILNQDDTIKTGQLIKELTQQTDKTIIDQLLLEKSVRQIIKKQDSSINVKHKVTLEEKCYFELIQSMNEFYKNVGGIDEEKENQQVINALKNTINKYTPTYEMVITIISTLINNNRWNAVSTCSDILSKQPPNSYPSPTIARLTNTLLQLSKLLSSISLNLISIHLFSSSSKDSMGIC